ncbi:MAG: phage tail protein [Candidatus Binataceae bacterium]
MAGGLDPFHVFRFQVDFNTDPIGGGTAADNVPICRGAFAECSGLEATMEPKVIKEGGRNYGPVQRMGLVSFTTVVLKRGVTTAPDLFRWFELVGNGAYAYRLAATVTMFDASGTGVLSWKLEKALPIKFRAASFIAKSSTDVGIEELHLAHEGLTLIPPKVTQL